MRREYHDWVCPQGNRFKQRFIMRKQRREGICEDYSAVVVALQRDETLGTIEDGVRVEACRRVANNLWYILYETYR